jgi:hypothetical protein
MNKPRMIWGIICLALAVLIGVLSAALPPGTITFMVEGTNQVWVPAAVLGVLGIVMLVSAARHSSEAEQPTVVDKE